MLQQIKRILIRHYTLLLRCAMSYEYYGTESKSFNFMIIIIN